MKGIGDLGDLSKLQQKIARLEEDLKERVVEGAAGGNVVRVLMNGAKELLKVEIKPEVVDPDDVEMLEDLIVAAVNQAREKVEKMHAEEMSKVMGGMEGLLGGFMGLLG